MLNKETKEFLDLLFALIEQGVDSFEDGAQLSDAPDFIDELTQIPQAINGLAPNFLKEARESTPRSVDTMMNAYQDLLIGKGMKPMLAYTIVNSMKSIYGAISLSASAKTTTK